MYQHTHKVSIFLKTEFQAKKVATIIERNYKPGMIPVECPMLGYRVRVFSMMRARNVIMLQLSQPHQGHALSTHIKDFTGEAPIITVAQTLEISKGFTPFVALFEYSDKGFAEETEFIEFPRRFAERYPDVLDHIYNRFLVEAQALSSGQTGIPTV